MGASGIIRSTLQPARNLADVQSVVTSKTNLLLQNVDNTSDVNKPVSTAQQTALNLKANLSGGAVFSGGNVDITDASGRVRMTPSGDITAYRSGGATGYLFLRSAQDRYLGFDGTNYVLPTAPLAVGSAVLVNGSDYVMTRGAAETVTGLKTFNAAIPLSFARGGFDVWQFIQGTANTTPGFGLLNATEVVYSAWFSETGNLGIGNVDPAYKLHVTGTFDATAVSVGGKQALSHAGAYTSGKVTYSTSAPSGGSDGDLWLQYV